MNRHARFLLTHRAKVRPILTRLAYREYLPMAGMMAAWSLIALSVGHADAVRLLAATTLVQSIRTLCTLEVTQALTEHIALDRATYRRSRRLALLIDFLALVVCLAVLLLIAGAMYAGGMEKSALMVAIGGIAIPARNPGAIFVAKRNRAVTWSLASAGAAAAGAALVFGFHAGWLAAAFVIALRPWFGLSAVYLFGPRKIKGAPASPDGLTFHGAAGATEALARRQLGYRVVKSVFSIFGPVGNLAARTGRGAARLDTKIANLIPRHRPGMFVFATGCCGAAIALLTSSHEPSAFLGAAAFARVAAAAGASLIWWDYATATISEDDDDDN